MYRYFTHYWKNDTWRLNEQRTKAGAADKLLNHVADTSFEQKGIEARDFVYPVTIFEGAMHLMCKLEVCTVCDFEEAAAYLGTMDIWNGASDHVIAVQPVPKHFNLAVPVETARRLGFVSEGSPGLVFKSRTQLDQQTLRGVRELAPTSAMKLDRLLLWANSESSGTSLI